MNVLDARFIASAREANQLPPPTFAEVAFAGRSNVGKSSLINSLLNRRKLVRTSNTPGCTRAINVFRVELSEMTLDFIDLPGYGYARRSKKERRSWGPLIEGFLRTRDSIRTVVLIIDVRRGIQDEEHQLLDFIEQLNHSLIIAATKIDKLPASRRKFTIIELQRSIDYPVFGYSSTSNLGREPLLQAILKKTLPLNSPS